MYLPPDWPSKVYNYINEYLMAPIAPKNLRLSTILIAIGQLIMAHMFLFLVLLGLAHSEQIKHMLAIDIEDQKDNGFYDMLPFNNQKRLHTASQLVEVTETFMYILTAVAAIYLLSTISLFLGIYKNQPAFVLPWLIIDFICIVALVVFCIYMDNEKAIQLLGGRFNYCLLCLGILTLDGLMWFTVHCYYRSLRTMDKLRKIATVAIPCPPPDAIPFHFRRENMYLGSNGYKHILSEAPDGNF